MKTRIPYVVFTDLDGTLLDPESYSYQAATPALAALRHRKIPLVFCTSKTRQEVEAARTELGNQDPFIVENGGAIFVPRGYFPFPIPACKTGGPYDAVELGVPYSEVVAVLRYASRSSGCPVRGFHDMSAAEVAWRCRLSMRDAEIARRREYDEPFLVLSDSPREICGLLNRIETEGLTWTHGGRFYHIRGDHSKGQAARILVDLFRRLDPGVATVGLGDGPNDISLLDAVDLPIMIPPDYEENPRAWWPSAARWSVASEPGPTGWNQEILRLLNGGWSPLSSARQ